LHRSRTSVATQLGVAIQVFSNRVNRVHLNGFRNIIATGLNRNVVVVIEVDSGGLVIFTTEELSLNALVRPHITMVSTLVHPGATISIRLPLGVSSRPTIIPTPIVSASTSAVAVVAWLGVNVVPASAGRWLRRRWPGVYIAVAPSAVGESTVRIRRPAAIVATCSGTAIHSIASASAAVSCTGCIS